MHKARFGSQADFRQTDLDVSFVRHRDQSTGHIRLTALGLTEPIGPTGRWQVWLLLVTGAGSTFALRASADRFEPGFSLSAYRAPLSEGRACFVLARTYAAPLAPPKVFKQDFGLPQSRQLSVAYWREGQRGDAKRESD